LLEEIPPEDREFVLNLESKMQLTPIDKTLPRFVYLHNFEL